MTVRLSLGIVLLAAAGCNDDTPDDAECVVPEPVEAAPSGDLGILGDPIATTAPPWPSRTHTLLPTERWPDASRPLPTNAWWQRLAMGRGDFAIYPMPYQVRVDEDGLHVSLDDVETREFDVRMLFEEALVLGARDELGSNAVVDYDELSVTARWTSPDDLTLTTPIVRGMPYVTAQYGCHVPRIQTARTIERVNGETVPATVAGTRFELALGDETWVVYASEELTFEVQDKELLASGPFTGSLRAAVSTPATVEVLDAHASRVPTGGTVAATVDGDEATLTFGWEAVGEGELLMARLPHHEPVLGGVTDTALVFPSSRGEMAGVAGDRWEMTEQLPTIGFRAPSGIAANRVEAVRAALQGDVGRRVTSLGPYRGGTEMAQLGRLALIADELGETALASQYRSTLKSALEPWLEGTNANALAYDESWGGIVVDVAADDIDLFFGQGYYNDHHFHYGYHVYAAAAVAAGEPAWLERWADPVTHLVRDFANPSTDDPHYAVHRSKDWYVGHSWASGLSGERNQESSSEAVNAYNAVQLWGEVTGDDRLRDIGRLMTATEIRATQTYWHIPEGSAVYDEPFARNRVVGILYDRRATYSTFFGNRPEFIHGIQWLPLTPISELLLTEDYVAQAWPVAASGIDAFDIEESWRGLLIMGQGIYDREAAWEAAQTLTDFPGWNSRANTLYWLATRP